MRFTNDSEELLSSMMSGFEQFIKKKTPRQQRSFDKTMKMFYNEIKRADKHIKTLWKHGKIIISLKEVGNFDSISHCSLLNSTYVPTTIKTYIKNYTKGRLSYSTTIANKKITIVFYLMSDSQFNELARFDNLVYKMFIWLKFVNSYIRHRCNKTLNIHCYLTPMKKIIPSSPFTILSPINANTAVTTSCTANGEICIFRTEEIFKVFIEIKTYPYVHHLMFYHIYHNQRLIVIQIYQLHF